MKNLIMILLVVLSVSCNGQDNNMKDTPIVTVIKLQSSEALLNFDEAKKYIDVEKVFGENPESKKSPQEEWKEMVTFFYNLGDNKKFTNQFKYFNYNITETIDVSNAKVKFAAINQDSHIKEIIYSLDKIKDRWKVTNIQYVN
ncbi:hypothetical protein [Abyssalbus ytuae]|uniref:DUF4878 domain-containing protein n=1 Tax=Abyssalbus ytuae TaxID=2926907 RepID=A0A9E7D3B6_9FLAO|nr:hypothetical protein [Abyssalbus ytuae]UOB17664.1 hypothetical protein MQE35_18225 [Abyssalbus ytuae]